MPIVTRTNFASDPTHGGFTGSVQLDSRTATVAVRPSPGSIDAAWDNAERVLTFLRDQMPLIEQAVRDLFSRLGSPSEDTPAGRRKIERMLGRLRECDMTCRIHDDAASVYFDAPRLTDHVIEVQFTKGGKLASATVAG